MSVSEPTPRTQVRRHPERGAYDPETVRAIIDEAPICHVAVVVAGQPRVLPMLHARGGSNFYLLAAGMTAPPSVDALGRQYGLEERL